MNTAPGSKRDEAGEGARVTGGPLRQRPGDRVPQPFTMLNGPGVPTGEDLAFHLRQCLSAPQRACLHVIVGPAGAGKSVLFHALFSQLSAMFLAGKKALRSGSRPIPLLPSYLRDATAVRATALVENFLRLEMDSPVDRPTFEWLLNRGYILPGAVFIEHFHIAA